MSRRGAAWLVLALILGLAAVLRLSALELRPPHHDEGVNGWFVERIVTDGYYTYDPSNYHGPSYFYLLTGAREAFGYGLWQLRLPGALVGVVMCALPLLLRRRLGWSAALAAAGVLALSPTLVYFARYAIHETLLAALGLLVAACMLRWGDGGRSAWLVGAAAALAGMIATKETTIIFLGVSGLWLAAETVVESVRARRVTVLGHACSWSWRVPVVALAMLLVMATIHVLLFTGFFQTPGSIAGQLRRSLSAYFIWSRTGTGETGHAKDWCYYLHLATRYELALYVLAAIGTVAGFRERWIRGPALVGAGMLVAYSLVAYKMPWLPMSWLVLLAVPAGHGVVTLARLVADDVGARYATAVALALAFVPPLAITVRSSFVRPADRREALAYVHTAPDYNRWFPIIEAAGQRLGRSHLVVSIDHDAVWPLPWSFSRYPQTRWSATDDADVLIVAASRAAKHEERLRTRGYDRREYQLRDSAEAAVFFFRRDVFADVLATR